MDNNLDGHQIFRLLHASVGMIGVVMFFVAALARKGGRLHINAGCLFACCGFFVGATGTGASIWGLLSPMTFLPFEETRSMTSDQAAVAAANLQFILSITGFLGLSVLSSVALGIGVLRVEDRHARLRHPGFVLLLVVPGLWSAALALHAAGSLIASRFDWPLLPPPGGSRFWISLVIGLVGVYGTMTDLRYVFGAAPTRSERWAVHIHCMISSGSGFLAAFFLFGSSQLLSLPGILQLAAPLVPIGLGAVAISLCTRYYVRES